MFKIGYRTIKTAIGAAIAIAIAQSLGLMFYASAGIITILCVQKTKRQSLKISLERFLACTVGLLMGSFLFELLGYHPITVAILLVLFIPIVVLLKAQEGIATSSVIIMHLYVLGEVTLSIIFNELSLVFIGIGVALIINMYMPNVEKELSIMQNQIEENFKEIFFQFSVYLKEGDNNWDGKEITATAELLKRGKDIALQNIRNHLLRYDDQYYHYFKMREKQFELLERMLSIVSSLDHSVIQSKKIAHFLEELSNAVTPGESTVDFLERLDELKQEFKQMDLPKDRNEFEIRSALQAFVKEIEQYLMIKREFKIKKE